MQQKRSLPAMRCLQMFFRLTQDHVLGYHLLPLGACVGRSDLLFHRTFHLFQINNVLLSFRHVATEKSIAVTCYTGSVSGATSSMLPCCSRNTRWQRRANAKLWVAMREVS
jgi:hypothetical protein